MTEKEFWEYMEKAWAKGRVNQVSGSMDSLDPNTQATGEYLHGHAMLPQDYDKIPERELSEMADLLFQDGVTHRAKEVILIILAHQTSKVALTALKKYNRSPDKGLEYFAQIALDECKMWN